MSSTEYRNDFRRWIDAYFEDDEPDLLPGVPEAASLPTSVADTVRIDPLANGEAVTIQCVIDTATGLPMVVEPIESADVFGNPSLNMTFKFERPVSDEILRQFQLPNDLLDPGNKMDTSQWGNTFEPNRREPALSQETTLTGMEPGLSTTHRKK